MSKKVKVTESRFSSPLPQDTSKSVRGATIILSKEKSSKSDEISLTSRESTKTEGKKRSSTRAVPKPKTNSLQFNRSSTQIKSGEDVKSGTKTSILSTSKERKFDPTKFEIILGNH